MAVLESKVRSVSDSHYRSLSKERRGKERVTSREQWDLVKQSLARLHVMEPFTSLSLEVSLLSLQSVLHQNTNLACVVLAGINTFFHQVRHQDN